MWDLRDVQVIGCPLSSDEFSPESFNEIEKVNWLSLANGHTEPHFAVEKKEVLVSA